MMCIVHLVNSLVYIALFFLHSDHNGIIQRLIGWLNTKNYEFIRLAIFTLMFKYLTENALQDFVAFSIDN